MNLLGFLEVINSYSQTLARLFFSPNCYFDGALRRIDWRNFEYSHCLVLIAVAVAPRVSAFRFRVTD